jgi:hypothetical protein
MGVGTAFPWYGSGRSMVTEHPIHPRDGPAPAITAGLQLKRQNGLPRDCNASGAHLASMASTRRQAHLDDYRREFARHAE